MVCKQFIFIDIPSSLPPARFLTYLVFTSFLLVEIIVNALMNARMNVLIVAIDTNTV